MTTDKKTPESTDIPDNEPSINDLSKFFDAITKIVYSIIGESPGSHFLSFWLINFMVYIVTLGAIFQFIPSGLEWLNKFIFYGCVITSFFASVFSTFLQKDNVRYYKTPLAIITSLKITVIGVGVMVILYGVFFYFNPTIYVPVDKFNETVSDLRNEFHTLDLNDIQINQILVLLREGGYVTKDELPEGLTEQQKTEVLKIINSSIQSFAATLTAMPKTSCYLTLQDIAESVYIREKADKSSGKIIDYLDINDIALVLGHDGNPNDGWWYIEITHRGKTTKGWIATKWVKLQNIENCSQVRQIATPFP